MDAVSGQRKMMALLAVLAVARRRGISREKLEALLWPESDQARARGALKQALHSLRKQLGTRSAVLGVGELRLNASVVESDVDRFLGALESGELEEAIGLYAGPFLDGLHLSGAPEFERWAESWREELGRRHAEATQRLAVLAGERGDHAAAVHWWRRLRVADPLSSRVTLELMRALEDLGERAAAIRCGAEYEALFLDEVGTPPDPSIAAFTRTLLERGRPAELPDGQSPGADHSALPRGTKIPTAYELYLQARQRWRLRTPDGLREAVRYYEGAVEMDPGLGGAWAGLAEAYVNLSNHGHVETVEALSLAERAADRALRLDAGLAEAHAAKGFVLACRLEFAAAEAEFREAVRVNADYTWARHYYTLLLLMLGRTAEALEQNGEALRTDPLSRPANATRGVVLCQGGDYLEAAVELERALTLGSGYPVALAYLGVVRAALGEDEAALGLMEEAARVAPDFPNVPAALAYLYSERHRGRDTEVLVAALRERAGEPRARVNLALALAALRRRDEAFEVMETAQWDVPSLIALRADPLLRHLREDPRYPRLLHRIGAGAAPPPGP